MNPVIIDCDPGIDDALALFLAAGSKELKLLAVTTVAGNRPVRTTAHNARKILNLAGRPDIPVHAGAARPLSGLAPRCNLVHGEDGLGGVLAGDSDALNPLHAVDSLLTHLRQSPAGSLDLVATGPLTNLALAELLEPGILQRTRRLLIMGGALRVPGNITPASEFNFYADPLAADIVMRCGAEMALFGLDVTHQAIMSTAWIESIGALPNRCGQAAFAMLQAYAQLDPLLHDVCPVAALLQPEVFGMQACRVEVDWRPGSTEGHVLAHFDPRDGAAPNVQAALHVDNQRLLALVREKLSCLP